MRRGRPRYNDVLTPREWEVLNLLRQGLTNEQIAMRLGITFDTAKFHVSEILGKLGVDTRQEAAAWRGQPRTVPVPSALPSIWQRLGFTSPLRVIAGAAIATMAIGLLALAGGLLLMSSRDGEEPAAPNVEARTGDEALDSLIDAVLTADAPSLASRFAGVTAREGVIIGGPIGIYQPATVPTTEWTTRLAAATRKLYAVVRDPVEPYPWNQSPPLPTPRAAIYSGSRDYDVLLIVTESGLAETAWRLSVDAGNVVDLIIDNVPANTTQPYPDRSGISLLLRLRDLMPSLDDALGSFVVLPPDDMLPPPVEPGAPGPRQPSGVANPPHAPAGRTGIPDVDRAIDALVSDSAASLARAYPTPSGTQEDCRPVPQSPGVCNSEESRVTVENWTQRLVAGRKGLYAVTTSNTAQVDVFIGVDGGSHAFEAWRFSLTGGRITSLRIYMPLPPDILDARASVPGAWAQFTPYTPSLSHNYEQYYVLPPRDLVPPAPRGHDLTVRTGVTGVDAILAILSARDPARLAAALLTPETTLMRKCGTGDTMFNRAQVTTWASDTLPRVLNVASVVQVPTGYRPDADHLVLANTTVNPYRWETLGLLERGGRIIAVMESGDWCPPDALYPPAAYLVPPPPGGTQVLNPARRSGIPAVDAVLDAGYAGDAAKMDTLISYGTPCGNDYAPSCPPGAPAGTLVEGLTSTACHGGYETRAQAPQAVIDLVRTSALYGVVDQSGTPAVANGLKVVLVGNDGNNHSSVTMTFDEKGVTSLHRDCAGFGPDALLSGKPNFLLPPP